MVLIHRRSLPTNNKVQKHGKYNPGGLKNLTLLAGGLYIQLVFTAGLAALHRSLALKILNTWGIHN